MVMNDISITTIIVMLEIPDGGVRMALLRIESIVVLAHVMSEFDVEGVLT